MRVSEAWRHYYDHTGAASDAARKLAFTGIGLIWILSGGGVGNVEEVTIAGEYRAALYSLILGLALDLAQYTVLSARWRLFARAQEKSADDGGHDRSTWEFTAPKRINLQGEMFFASKIILISFGFGWLLVSAARQLL